MLVQTLARLGESEQMLGAANNVVHCPEAISTVGTVRPDLDLRELFNAVCCLRKIEVKQSFVYSSFKLPDPS